MYVKQIYTNCLSQASYYIESNRDAIIIDPIRDSALYMNLIKERKSNVKYIFETHFHADFISGHLDLSKLLNAPIVFGPDASTNYNIINAKHEQLFEIGNIKIQVLHTPGHTPESSCLLLYDEEGNRHSVFTGDTLFVGEVGRPDLAVSENISKEFLATQLFDSLHNILMKLNDNIILYPGHGPGSSCGANIGKETVSTIGEQRKTNYVLQKKNKQEFLDLVLNNISPPPSYFSHDARLNKMGYQDTDLVIKNGLNKISSKNLAELLLDDMILLDVRMPNDFEKKHIKNSINIGKTPNSFASWVGTLIPFSKKIIIVCYEGDQIEVISRLARIGYENIYGFISDINDIDELYIDNLESILASEIFSEKFSNSTFLDVRNTPELSVGLVEDSVNIPLKDLNQRLNTLDSKKEYLVYCAGGYRSMMAASILRKNNFSKVINIKGGFNSILTFL
tara:strand:+ start:785 stop:2137 length:1353 start_codon:yes stop_codon:yes gene_type:complete